MRRRAQAQRPPETDDRLVLVAPGFEPGSPVAACQLVYLKRESYSAAASKDVDCGREIIALTCAKAVIVAGIAGSRSWRMWGKSASIPLPAKAVAMPRASSGLTGDWTT